MESEPGFHGCVGVVAERVIEEMREDVGEHDEAADQPHLPDTDPAQPTHQGRWLLRCLGAYIDNRWCLQGHAGPNETIGRNRARLKMMPRAAAAMIRL